MKFAIIARYLRRADRKGWSLVSVQSVTFVETADCTVVTAFADWAQGRGYFDPVGNADVPAFADDSQEIVLALITVVDDPAAANHTVDVVNRNVDAFNAGGGGPNFSVNARELAAA